VRFRIEGLAEEKVVIEVCFEISRALTHNVTTLCCHGGAFLLITLV